MKTLTKNWPVWGQILKEKTRRQMTHMIEWPAHLDIRHNMPLKSCTKIRIGGPARYYTQITTREKLLEITQLCRKYHIRFIPMGAGTNVLFADEGIDGLVAVLALDQIDDKNNVLTVQAGVSLKQLVDFCAGKNLTGIEFAAGIPGTVGGAVFGNAGAYGKAVGDILTSAVLLTPEGKIIRATKNQMVFTYRSSRLKKSKEIVIEATFSLKRGEKSKILEEMDGILRLRQRKLPADSAKTAGSWFKNIKDAEGNATAAAIYLDAVGGKKTAVNDAGIFQKHANIFINHGNASARDMLQLEEILKNRVYEKYNIILEREVMYIS